MITKQFLHEYVVRDAETRNAVNEAIARETRSMFETVVRGIIDYTPDALFGMLAEVVAETKEKGADGKPVKGAKADAATQTRMSELRQIYGAFQGGWDFSAILPRGREATVTEARAYLKDNGLTAKGETVESVRKRTEARKLGKAARDLMESDEGIDLLSEEQIDKVEAGMPLALVITPEQRDKLAEKARLSVEADKVKAKVAAWQKRADALIDAMVEDGIGEADLRVLVERIVHRADAWMQGSDPRVSPLAEVMVPGPALV